MRLLVLGGTVFLGRAVARHARAAGHEVTCAARGESRRPRRRRRGSSPSTGTPDGSVRPGRRDVRRGRRRRPAPEPRAAALSTPAGRVGPLVVRVQLLGLRRQRHPRPARRGAPWCRPPRPRWTTPTGRRRTAPQGHLRAARTGRRRRRPGVHLPGGPDRRARRTRAAGSRTGCGGWPAVARCSRPGDPDERVQFVDVRDLAAWLVTAAETGLTGPYDGIGAPMTRGEFLAGVAAGVAAEPTLTWVDQEFLAAQDVRPWMGERALPLWLPLPDYAGFMTRDTSPRAGRRPAYPGPARHRPGHLAVAGRPARRGGSHRSAPGRGGGRAARVARPNPAGNGKLNDGFLTAVAGTTHLC